MRRYRSTVEAEGVGWLLPAVRRRPLLGERFVRPAVAIVFLALATLLSRVGLIDLIARGYGTLTWVFIVIFVIPVLTVGIWKILQAATVLPIRDL